MTAPNPAAPVESAESMHSLSAVAARLGLGEGRVRRLIKLGQLRAIRTGARRLFVPGSAVAEYLERLNGAGAPQA